MSRIENEELRQQIARSGLPAGTRAQMERAIDAVMRREAPASTLDLIAADLQCRALPPPVIKSNPLLRSA